MSDTQSESKAPQKEAPADALEKIPAEPKQDADSSDAAWSEDILEWAIASSTCGGLPHKKDQNAEEEKDTPAAEDKPACP